MGTNRVLVTGGAGFIGQATIQLLLEHNYKVRLVDNYSGHSIYPRPIESPNLELVTGDLRDLPTCRNVCQGMDYVLHLAGYKRNDDMQKLHENNTNGSYNLLVGATEAKVKKFVYASSASAYFPVFPYGASKAICENYAQLFYKWDLLPVIGLRYFNVYGDPNTLNDSVIAKFVKNAMSNEPLIVYGDGKQTRDYVHVEDVAVANLRALQALPSCYGKVFDIGTGVKTSLLAIIKKIKFVVERDIKVVHREEERGNVAESVADPTPAKEELLFTSAIKLNDGIGMAIEWCANNLNRRN